MFEIKSRAEAALLLFDNWIENYFLNLLNPASPTNLEGRESMAAR